MKKGKPISIFVMGETYHDHAVTNMTSNLIKEAFVQDIPIIHCESQPMNYTLTDRMAIIVRSAVFVKDIGKMASEAAEMQGLYGFHDGLRALFLKIASEEDWIRFTKFIQRYQSLKIVQAMARGMPEENIKKWIERYPTSLYVRRFLEANTDNESLFLYAFLQYFQIPYYGIEVSGNELAQVDGLDEKLRIEIMMKNLVSTAIPKVKESGGILICKGGVVHAKRLAAYLLKELKEENVKVFSAECYSSYATEYSKATMKERIQELEQADSHQIKILMERVCAKEVYFKEGGDGKFSSQEFSAMVREALSHASAKPLEPLTFIREPQSGGQAASKSF